MLAKNFKKSLLAVNIGLVMSAGFTGAAYAADETKVQEDVEVIEVRGIRRSLEASLNTKRFANSVVDAVTAEDIGKFPDKNVAESLKRIPGITVQGQFGEADAVSIRGAGADFTKTTLNGQNVASTGWFVLEPAKRSFNYTLLPSELVGGLEVYKSSQADLIEGGIGGTVIVNTRTPLDLDQHTVYGSIEAQYSDDSGETDPQFSGLYSWKNEDENFGFLVSAVSQERNLQRQGNEAFWQWGAGPVGFEQDRKRTAFSTALEYQPNDQLNIVVNYIDMQMEANNTNYALWLTQADTTWGDQSETTWLGGNGTGDNPGVQVAGPLNIAFYQMRPREATMKSDFVDINLEYTGDTYKMKFVAGKTTSSGGTDFEMVMDDGLNPSLAGGTYDFTGGGQSWNLPADFDMSEYNPGTLVMGTGTNFNATPKTDEESFAQFDIEFMLDNDFITSVKTGVRWADHEATSRRFEFTQVDGFDNVYDVSNASTGTYDVGAGSYQIQRFDVDAMKKWAKASITGKTEDYGAYSHIEETNIGAYIMANYSGEKYRGNFGVRYVTTDAKSIYYKGADVNARTSEDADYNEFLPSVNFAYDISDDMIWRVNAARTMTRPQYNDMYFNPSLMGVSDDLPNNQRIIVGNPALKPFTANQFETGIEWYFNESSLLAATVFYKDVSNFIVIGRRDATAEEAAAFGVPELTGDEKDFGYQIEENSNGPGGEVLGLELQYQQDFGNGFGTLINYTYTDAKADYATYKNEEGVEVGVFDDWNVELTDSSDHAFNVSGYYENELFYARLSYNYRSEYMMREAGSYGNRLHEGFGSLDLSAVYHVTDNVDVKLDVVNILGESSEQFGNHQRPMPYSGFTDGFPLYEYEQATRYNLGLSVRF
ncbi:TonB-dependent receptor [Pseudoalteromonas gelatinilytica]